jgi:hypothetical protein
MINNEEDQEQEQEQEQKQPEMKLTLELLKTPDDKIKNLFAKMDLKAFLDKAKADLIEAGKDPRDACINLSDICWHVVGGYDEAAKSKIKLDVLLQYPLWQYGIDGILSEEDKNKLKDLDGRVLEFNREEKCFFTFPSLSETNGTLTVKDDVDVTYWVEKQESGVKMLAFAVKHALQSGKNISVIDISEITLRKGAECDFKYFAGLPVSLRGEWLETKSKEVNGRPGVRSLSNDTMLVCRDGGTFSVRYEPKYFYKVFDISDVFMKNLRETLIQHADFPTGNDTLEKAVQSLKVEDFKCLPFRVSILNNGSLQTANDPRFGCDKEHLFDLVYGTANDDSMKS